MEQQKGKLDKRVGDREVVTVVLSSSEATTECKSYHCHKCGKIVLNYYSDVSMIIEGELRDVTRPVDVYCSKCGLVHRFA